MTEDPSDERDLAEARARLAAYFRPSEGDPLPWRDVAVGRQERLNADVLRLAAMKSDDLYRDQEAVATLLEIADLQGWT